MLHKLESTTSDMQVITPLWQKAKKIEEPLDESERGEWKLNIQKTKIMASGPITLWQIDGETMEIVTDFIFGGLQNRFRWWL